MHKINVHELIEVILKLFKDVIVVVCILCTLGYTSIYDDDSEKAFQTTH